MDMQDVAKEVEENIEYQIDKLEFLCSESVEENKIFLSDHLNLLNPNKKSIKNQVYTDSILNAMASLIDYYCIYCFIKIGIREEKITKIQYRPINNKYLIKAREQNKKTDLKVDELQEFFHKRITDHTNLKPGEIDINDYWICFFGDAISCVLYEVGLVNERNNALNYDAANNKFIIEKNVAKYFYYMNFLFCNRYSNSGVRYNIYVDINNCLKHNVVPHLAPKVESFNGEVRMYSYFKLKNSDSIFLKDGILKSIVKADFEILKSDFSRKSNNPSSPPLQCTLENELGLGPIITLDPQNGYLSKDQETIYFFIDTILIAKNRDATLVDANNSLLDILRTLIREIRRGVHLDV